MAEMTGVFTSATEAVAPRSVTVSSSLSAAVPEVSVTSPLPVGEEAVASAWFVIPSGQFRP